MTPEQLDALCMTTCLPFAVGLLDWDGHQAAQVETHDDLSVVVAFSSPPRVMIFDGTVNDGCFNISTDSLTVEGIAEAVNDGLVIARSMRPPSRPWWSRILRHTFTR